MVSEKFLRLMEERKQKLSLQQEPTTSEQTQQQEQKPTSPQQPQLTTEEKSKKVKEMVNIFREYKQMVGEGKLTDNLRADIFDEWKRQGFVEQEKIIVKVKEPISSKEKLEYSRLYREEQKRLLQMKNIEAMRTAKIQTALKRKMCMCFRCSKSVPCVNATYKIKEKRSGQKRIQIISSCPFCSKLITSKGGYLP